MTLETVTLNDFLPLVASSFQIDADNVDFSLELIEASPARTSLTNAARQSFSLLFRGPLSPQLNQQIVRLKHQALGLLEVFLVPIGVDEFGTKYEAVFN